MRYLGVDVSRKTLEVADASGSCQRQFPNTAAGLARLTRWLGQEEPTPAWFLILEPTSTYHQPLVKALAERGIPYAVVNPARAAAFAKAQGKRAKTDASDARLLAQFGQTQQPNPNPAPDAAREQLRALRRHLEWLEEQLQGAKNRREAAQFSPWTPAPVLDSLERAIAQLEGELVAAEQALTELAQGQPAVAKELELLASIPGVGWKTALLVGCEMLPVAHFSTAKQWVAYAGLNPELRESGQSRGSRLCRMGSRWVRAGLYLPAVSALRWNPMIHALGERLKERGKTGRQRVVAAMHKLLRQCYGVLKSGRPFDPTRHCPLPVGTANT